MKWVNTTFLFITSKMNLPAILSYKVPEKKLPYFQQFKNEFDHQKLEKKHFLGKVYFGKKLI